MIDWKSKYDSENFRKQGYALVDQLAEYLSDTSTRKTPVIKHKNPEESLAFWKDYQIENIDTFYQDLLDQSIKPHHPRYIGHQVSAPIPESALSGLYTSLLNNGMGIYEMGEGPTAIERACVVEMCSHLGYGEKSGGFMTSGGTLANLTALLAARKYAINHLQMVDQKMVVLVSEQAHFCIERACGTMGMLSDQIIKIPSNDGFQMDLDSLSESLQFAKHNNQCVMAVVASCCSTATGSYDDLGSIITLCAPHNIWVHVDGAHGGAAILSKEYKHLLHQVDKAHSVIIDAHKMMLTPSLATIVLFSDEANSYDIFQQDASYLFSEAAMEWFDLAKRTYETTKYMMCIKTFIAMRYHGVSVIGEFVTRQYNLARDFAEYLLGTKDFETAHSPMSNILCFRWKPLDLIGDVNTINKEIRAKLLANGKWYIVQAQLRDATYLRISIMNPLTNLEDLIELSQDIRSIGLELSNSLIKT